LTLVEGQVLSLLKHFFVYSALALWGAAGSSVAWSQQANQNTGYVVPSPRISLMYWHDDWNKHNPVARGQIRTFVRSLISNNYFSWAVQYGVSGVSFGDGYNTGLTTIPCGPRRAPASVSTREIQDWLTCMLTLPHPTLPLRTISGAPIPIGSLVPGKNGAPPVMISSDLYVVILPTGTTISDDLIQIALPGLMTQAITAVFGSNIYPVVMKRVSCDHYNAFHNFLVHSTATLVAYAVVPLDCAKEPVEDVFLSTGTSFQGAGLWTSAGTYGAGWFPGNFKHSNNSERRRVDLVRYINNFGGAEVLLSKNVAGTNKFAPEGSWSNAGTSGARWFVGDFNGDGLTDLARYTGSFGGAEVLLSNGSNAFASAGTWTGAGTHGAGWFVGDFNGDGRADLVRYTGQFGGAEVLLSNGTNAFTSAGVWTGAGTYGAGWFVGDFNGDGKADLVRYTSQSGGAEVLLSNGTNAFVSAGIWTQAGTRGAGWFVGDFNGDGKSDLARYINSNGGAEVFLSNGTNAFVSAGTWTAAGTGGGRWVVGDFDGDGKADLKRTVSPQWVNPNSFKILTAAISHEIIEAATDPIPAASWIDNSQSLVNFDRLTKGEVSDICAATVNPPNGTAQLGGYTVAQYWSNFDGGCRPK
jgi:hypothetical protein